MRRMYDSGPNTDADRQPNDDRDQFESDGWQGSFASDIGEETGRPAEHDRSEAWTPNLAAADLDNTENSWLRRDNSPLDGWRSTLDGEGQPTRQSRHREALTDIARSPWTESAGTGPQRRTAPRFLADEPEGERPQETVWAGAEPESEFDVPLGRDYVAEARAQRLVAPRQAQPEPRRQANLSDRIKAKAMHAPEDDGPSRDLQDILNTQPAPRSRRPAPKPVRKSRNRLLRTAALATTFCLSAGAGIGIYLMLQQEHPAAIGEALDPVRTLLAPETPAAAKPVQKAAVPERASDASKAAPAATGGSQPPKVSIAAAAPPSPKPAPAITPTPVSTGQQAKTAQPPVQQKKPRKIETARLDVRDVQGQAKEFIPLGLRFVPSASADESALRITGLPRDAILTAGQRAEDGSWTLKAGEEKGLRLVVPFADQPTRFDVSVEAIDTRAGALQAPVREMRVSISPASVVIEPAAAPATTARNFVGELEPGPPPKVVEASLTTGPDPVAEGTPPDAPEAPPEPLASQDAGEAPAAPEPAAQEPAEAAPAPAAGSEGSTTAGTDTPQLAALQPADDLPAAEEDKIDPMQPPAETGGIVPSDPVVGLIARGDELLSLGDVIAARRLYERAVEMGHQPAAAKLARTYDPVVFKKLNVQGMLPDPDKALQWYRHAEKAGVEEVAADIAALNNWLKQ